MKKILLGLSFLAFQTTVCRAQIKNLFPEKNKIYLSDKAAAEYEKNQKLGEQFIKQKGDNMTDADWEYLANSVLMRHVQIIGKPLEMDAHGTAAMAVQSRLRHRAD